MSKSRMPPCSEPKGLTPAHSRNESLSCHSSRRSPRAPLSLDRLEMLKRAKVLYVVLSSGMLHRPSIAALVALAARYGLALQPVMSEASFAFPSQVGLYSSSVP